MNFPFRKIQSKVKSRITHGKKVNLTFLVELDLVPEDDCVEENYDDMDMDTVNDVDDDCDGALL